MYMTSEQNLTDAPKMSVQIGLSFLPSECCEFVVFDFDAFGYLLCSGWKGEIIGQYYKKCVNLESKEIMKRVMLHTARPASF